MKRLKPHDRVLVTYWPRWWDEVGGRSGEVKAVGEKITVQLDQYEGRETRILTGTEENFTLLSVGEHVSR